MIRGKFRVIRHTNVCIAFRFCFALTCLRDLTVSMVGKPRWVRPLVESRSTPSPIV